MKRKAILILMLLVQQAFVFSQGCLPEGISFTDQEQIDNFQINYPECTEIEGDVKIAGGDISNLNGLNVLTTIGGNLWVGYDYIGNPLLPNLTGLNNLTTVDGDILINFNILAIIQCYTCYVFNRMFWFHICPFI